MVSLASRWKINFSTEFRYGNECSLVWRGEYDLLIPPLDANSFWVLKKISVMDAQTVSPSKFVFCFGN